MLYYKLSYGVLFLPVTMIIYQLISKRFRWVALLIASIFFYYIVSSYSIKYLAFPVLGAVITWGIGLWLEKLEKKRKEMLGSVSDKSEKSKIKAGFTKKSRGVLILGILALLSMLLYLKYFNFFIINLNSVLAKLSVEHKFSVMEIMIPLGVSFYTMQAMGYMADVYWKKVPAEKNPLKMLLFLTFFPTIVEGPIASYTDVRKTLFGGESIDPDNVIRGYIRISWGAMKKLVIADRLYPAVNALFDMSYEAKGGEVLAAAVLFTVMEYLDFSGCMDMVLGSATVFGVKLPENFRQPFFARNASEFWRRWHISLGVWFKTYIFYPVSMSNLAKKWGKFSKGRVGKHASRMVASAMALLPVWICNGLWHGPKWTYIFYGIFYFVVIMTELIFEPLGDMILAKLKLTRENKAVDFIRIFRTWIVIFVGELFFRADTLPYSFKMFKSMFSGFSLSFLWNGAALGWGLDIYDWLVVLFGLLIVIIVNVIKEKGTDILGGLLEKPMALRWALTLGILFIILIFGLYGPGYQEVDMIYAGF